MYCIRCHSNIYSSVKLLLGNYDIVSLFCARRAEINVTFPVGVGKLGFSNTFAAAAAFGRRKILRKLLAEAPAVQDDDMMSLAEILAAEGEYDHLTGSNLSIV